MRRVWILLGIVWFAGMMAWIIGSNEWILARGEVLRLALAPVDPRSLMQGDYMVLNYEVLGRFPWNLEGEEDEGRLGGYLVLTRDDAQRGKLVRRQAAAEPLQAGELAVRFRLSGGRLEIAGNSFFFEEGTGERYAGARYGEFRVGAGGEARLVALLDGDLHPLGENRR